MIPGRVSVIIPAYNYGRYLAECVGSVRAQTYTDWEIAICDDGSSDDTPQVGESVARLDPARIRYHRLPNGGVAAARNFGIAHTEGEFILPLDADDLLEPDALEEFIRALRADTTAGYAYSNLENYGALPGDLRVWLQGPFFPGRIVIENTAASASMWRRSLYDDGVRYRPFIFEDWDLWLQIVARSHRAAYVPKVLFKYRMHITGRTARNKYLYFPALLEVMQHNPTLYDPALVRWAESCLAFSPACWSKETIVFLPSPQSTLFREIDGPLAPLLDEFLRREHFCVVIGAYPNGDCQRPGLALLTVRSVLDVDTLAHKLGMIGSKLVVLSELPEVLNSRLRSLPNVHQLLRVIPEEDTGADTSFGSSSEIGLRPVPELQPSGDRFFLRQGGLDLFGGLRAYSGPDLADTLLEQAALESKAKTDRQKRYWDNIKNLSEREYVMEPLRKSLAIVVPCAHPDVFRLERSLQSLRSALPAAQIVVSDSGSGPEEFRSKLARLCESNGAVLISHATRAPFARGRLINLTAGDLNSEWLGIIWPETLADPALAGVLNHYWDNFSEGVLLGESAYLPPMSPGSLHEDFPILKARARFRDLVEPDVLFLPRELFCRLRGFSAGIVGEGSEFDDLLWRIDALGMQRIWLPRGATLRAWSLWRTPALIEQNNAHEIARAKQSLRLTNDHGWNALREEERAEFLAKGAVSVIAREQGALGPARDIEREVMRPDIDDPQRIAGILAWAGHCLRNREEPSARRAFEDVLSLHPQHIDALTGLAQCAIIRGGLALGGHYAAAALRLNAEHAPAREVLNMLREMERR